MSLINEPLILACTAFIVGTATPGPATLLIATTSMRFGLKVGLTSAFGVLTGSLAWGLLIAFGIGIVLGATTTWNHALRIAAGLYLILLSIKSARCALLESSSGTTVGTESPDRRTFGQGLLLHLSNPNAMLSWLASVAIATSSASTNNPGNGYLVVAVCWCLGIVIYCGYAIAFAHPVATAFYIVFRQKIELFAALLFGTTGMILLISR